MAKKNPDELATAINAIDRNVPPSKLPEEDRKLKENAQDALKKLDEPSSTTSPFY